VSTMRRKDSSRLTIEGAGCLVQGGGNHTGQRVCGELVEREFRLREMLSSEGKYKKGGKKPDASDSPITGF